MKNLNVPQPLSGGPPASRFAAAKATAFTLALSGPVDSYEHFGPGPFVNIRDVQGNEMICRIGGLAACPSTNGPVNSLESLSENALIKGDHHVGYQSHH